MSLRINTNVDAQMSANNLARTTAAISKSMQRLSTGHRINSAADDAAGLNIAEKMQGQIGGLAQAQANIQDGQSFVQTAEGNLDEVHSMLQRVRELAVQYKNGTLSTTEVQTLTTVQAGAITAAQIGTLTTTAIGNFSTTQLGALSTTQTQGLTTTQLNGLSSANFGALSSSKLSTGQIAGLTTTTVNTLSTTQVAALTTAVSEFAKDFAARKAAVA